MGWSCSKVANDTMTKLTKACVKQTKTQNVFKEKGKSYFWELSRREHADGSITGSIHRFHGKKHAVKVGSFKISGRTGEIVRGAKLKRLLKKGRR